MNSSINNFPESYLHLSDKKLFHHEKNNEVLSANYTLKSPQ